MTPEVLCTNTLPITSSSLITEEVIIHPVLTDLPEQA